VATDNRTLTWAYTGAPKNRTYAEAPLQGALF
jgi:hypothetical protein